MSDLAKLSADLMRVGEFLSQGREDLADRFLARDIKLYGDLDQRIGRYGLKEWLRLIELRQGGVERAAERAMTAGVVMLARSGA
jgi:hypothetical protein